MSGASLQSIRDVSHLEELLSEPTAAVIDMFGSMAGDVLVLGAAGKMGPSLARMAKRASDAAGTKRRIIAVSRFSNSAEKANFQRHGIETIRADLLDPQQLQALPDAPNVIYMAGMKFGAMGQVPLTWAMNAHLPAMVCRRYPKSRIAAFSTGNLYGLVPIVRGGSVETDLLRPLGEYATSCLGRERMFEYFSGHLGTPVSLIRLYYATEMRYGVIVDLATKIWQGAPIPLSMGNFSAIWQGDANAMALLSLQHAASPAFVVNVSGPETLSVRAVCQTLAALMHKDVTFEGEESPDALLSNAQLCHQLFGYPQVTISQVIRWIADWVMRGGASLSKPTHFEVRDGNY